MEKAKRTSSGRKSLDGSSEDAEKCKVCKKDSTSKFIQCDGCNTWVHTRCAKLSQQERELFEDQALNYPWFCKSCRKNYQKNADQKLKREELLKEENNRMKREIELLKSKNIELDSNFSKEKNQDCGKCKELETLLVERAGAKKQLIDINAKLITSQIKYSRLSRSNEDLKTQIASLEMLLEGYGINTDPNSYNFISIRKIGSGSSTTMSADKATDTSDEKHQTEIEANIKKLRPPPQKQNETLEVTSTPGSDGKQQQSEEGLLNVVSKTKSQPLTVIKTVRITKKVAKKSSLTECIKEQNKVQQANNRNSSLPVIDKNAKSNSNLGSKDLKTNKDIGSEKDDQNAFLLIGDSIIRHQDKEFVRKNPKHRKRICMPGASLATISNKCAEEIKETGNNTIHIISGGSNDIKCIKPSIILNKLREIIKMYKDSKRTLCITEILPRVSDSDRWQDETYIINQKMKHLCTEMEVTFIETYFDFYGNNHYYNEDGIHLNQDGSKALGDILNRAIKNQGN